MIKLLLVEDDKEISEIIVEYLKASEEYEIHLSYDIDSTKAYLNEKFDVILLDMMLPDGYGLVLCEEFRKTQSCPIIFISCISDDKVIINALSYGGDDYIVKPFSNQILDARIKANLRRVQLDKAPITNVKEYGILKLSEDGKSITIRGNKILLGRMEMRILTYLIEHPNTYFSSRELYKKLWGEPSLGDTRTVLVHIHNIRKKIEEDINHPTIIQNINGKGYILNSSALEI